MTVLIVTGTDTGVGKTIATATLAVLHGGAVYKPVQAGTEEGEGDIDVVRRLARGTAVHEGVRLPHPMAPVAAATRAGARLPPLRAHVERVRQLAEQGDVLVEGAGGLLVELDHDGHTLADLASALAAPVVVVCRSGLGTLNHTALTVEALTRRGITVAGLVIGSWPAHPSAIDVSNRAHLGDLLGVLPEGAGGLDADEFRRRAPGWLSRCAAPGSGRELPDRGPRPGSAATPTATR
ncbi:dethiobiotin synthase [Pseudonocardia sp. CA-107938]|uniref:dethiobiotin synthase n=1 Tax=Pseudonocardia sp. CA-107938 TaxID=3240021 RepID=UPI003D934B3C